MSKLASIVPTDLDGILSLLRSWKVAVPCTVATIAGIWMAIQRAQFNAKHAGKKLPPVYNKGIMLPFFGAAAQFLWDPLAMGRKGHVVYGDVFTVHVFGKRITFLCGPDAQELFCKSRDEELSQQVKDPTFHIRKHSK